MAEKKNEVSRVGKEGTVNSFEAAPGGLGLAEEPGKPGPLWGQRLWTASCQNLDSPHPAL